MVNVYKSISTNPNLNHSYKKACYTLGLTSLLAILYGCASDSKLGDATSCHQYFYNKPYNRPYEIKGLEYSPQKYYDYQEIGLASFYGGGDGFHGRKTSNGEVFDLNELSAAHKTLPIPCVVLVTNLENGLNLKLKINDRGPFIEGRIIDVSRKAARLLGFEHKGLTQVRVETLIEESVIMADNMARNIIMSKFLVNKAISVENSKEIYKHTVNSKQPTYDIVTYPYAIKAVIAKDKKRYNTFVRDNTVATVKPRIKPVYQMAHAAHVLKLNSFTREVFIQAGNFRDYTTAYNTAKKLKQANPKLPIKMQTLSQRQGKSFRVLIGPYKSNSQAHLVAKQVM